MQCADSIPHLPGNVRTRAAIMQWEGEANYFQWLRSQGLDNTQMFTQGCALGEFLRENIGRKSHFQQDRILFWITVLVGDGLVTQACSPCLCPVLIEIESVTNNRYAMKTWAAKHCVNCQLIWLARLRTQFLSPNFRMRMEKRELGNRPSIQWPTRIKLHPMRNSQASKPSFSIAI